MQLGVPTSTGAAAEISPVDGNCGIPCGMCGICGMCGML